MTAAQVAQDNAALVKRGYEAFAAGDVPTLQTLYDADAVFYSVPTQMDEGAHIGRDAIFHFFGRLFNESKGTFKASPTAITAAGDRVFVLQEVTGERNGLSLNETTVMLFTIDGGLVRKMREFFTPASRIKASGKPKKLDVMTALLCCFVPALS